MKPTEKQIERFNSRFVKTDTCWIWTWKKDKDGYGQFHARPFTQRAHRFSYIVFKGPIPDGHFVCHSCDNPSCVNPEHLWIGTVLDNNRDALNKGRIIPPFRGITKCKYGHELADDNVYKKAKNNGQVVRYCRECIRRRRRAVQYKIRGLPKRAFIPAKTEEECLRVANLFRIGKSRKEIKLITGFGHTTVRSILIKQKLIDGN